MTYGNALRANDELLAESPPNPEFPDLDRQAARERLDFYARTIGVEAPARMEDDEGAPTQEILQFCRLHGASLDWLILGDLTGMIHASRYAGTAHFPERDGTGHDLVNAYLDQLQERTHTLRCLLETIDSLAPTGDCPHDVHRTTLGEMAAQIANELSLALDAVKRPEVA